MLISEVTRIMESYITIRYETRPCYVQRVNKVQRDTKAMFHCWIQEKGKTMYGATETKALVEYENGTMHLVKPEMIRFTDGGNFNEVPWNNAEQADS